MAWTVIPLQYKFKRNQRVAWRGRLGTYLRKVKGAPHRAIVRLDNGLEPEVWVVEIRVDE